MKKILGLILAVVVGVSATGASYGQEGLERLFYYIDGEESFESLQENISKISLLAPGAYSVDEDGVVWGGVDPRVLELAREEGTPVMPLIHNPGFDQEMLTALLSSETARARAVESMLDECLAHGYLGIQFDFENLHINDRDLFTAFFRETAQALHSKGFKLSIAVVHRPEKFPGPTQYFKWLYKNWRAGYDLEALGEIADFVSVMTYSQHTRRTPPGPNAGVPWVKRNIEFFLERIPAEKLSLGIPVVSQHWRTEQDDERYLANARSWSRSLSHSEALALLDRFDAEPWWLEDQGTAFSFFENGGLFEWLFLEDERSFARKLELVRNHGLRGFSVWVLGYEDQRIWDSLDAVGGGG